MRRSRNQSHQMPSYSVHENVETGIKKNQCKNVRQSKGFNELKKFISAQKLVSENLNEVKVINNRFIPALPNFNHITFEAPKFWHFSF